MPFEPGCAHAERCPGCPLIQLPYADGLAAKAARLARAFGRYPELEQSGLASVVVGAESVTDYRTRAKLVSDGEGRLGLFAAGSHDVVDNPECRVLSPKLAEVARALRALLPLEIPLRGVDLRLCDRGVLVSLVVLGRPEPSALGRVQARVLQALPHVVGLAVNIAQPGSVQLLGPELEVLHGTGAERHHLTLGAPWHYASHGAFTQVHAGQTARLHQRIEGSCAERLGGLSGRRVLELYAGSGALALRLAARGARVTAVEAFEPAVARLRGAAQAQALDVEAWVSDAEAFLALSGQQPGAEAAFDAVLVNPPRRGLAPGVRAALSRLAPKLLLYVSCEPETLARDLSHFALLGLGTEQVAGFDMIPLSDAVEGLARLEPRTPPAPRVLFEDATCVALYKLPFEATTPAGGSDVSLLDRARRGLALSELTPVQRLEVGTSGVCWFARRPEHVAPLAQALERGATTYLGLARGITHKKGKIARRLREGATLTRYRRTSVLGGHSLLELEPEPGSKPQLRGHLGSIGHPIIGDARHGQALTHRHFEHRHGLDRLFLHCASSRLTLASGPVEVQAALAGDLAAVLASLQAG